MVSKKQFENTYRKFSPTKCEIFYIKNISISSLTQRIWPAILTFIGLILPFIITVIAQIFHLAHCLISISCFLYIIMLAVIGLYSFSVWYQRRKRIVGICKELNISKKEYEKIVKKYYYENYYPDIKDYINSIIE